MSSEKQTSAGDLVWIGFALLLAAGVLTARLGAQGYWWDEEVTLMLTLEDWRALMIEHWALDHHRPFYYGLQKAWNSVAGESIEAVRMLPVTLALLSVPVFYAIARKLPGNHTALLLVVLLASFPMFVVHGRDVRMYGLLHLLLAVSLWIMACLVERQERRRALWGLFGLAMAAATYVHPIAVFSVAIYGLWILFCVARGLLTPLFLKEGLVAFVLFAICIAPAIAPFFWQADIQNQVLDLWYPEPTLFNVYVQTASVYPYPKLAKILVLGLFLWGAFKLPKDQPLSWLLLAFAIGFPLLIWLASFFSPIYMGRTIAWSALVALIIIAYGVASFAKPLHRLALVGALLVSQGLWLQGYHSRFEASPHTAFSEAFAAFDPQNDIFILGDMWREPALRWSDPHLFEGEVYGLAKSDFWLALIAPVVKSVFIPRAEAAQVQLGTGRVFVFYEEDQGSPDASVIPAINVMTAGRVLERETSANGLKLDVFEAQ